MLSLVLKDILVQKKSFATAAVFSVIFIIAFQGLQGQGAYLMGAIVVIYLLIAGAFGYDEKNKGDILVNSLPVNRKDIVAARYLSLLTFTVFGILLEAVVGFVITALNIPINIRLIGIGDIAAIIFCVSLVFSFYMPLYFKFGYLKSRFLNIVLYILCFAVSGVVSGLKQAFTEEQNDRIVSAITNVVSSIPSWAFGPIFVLFAFFIMLISYNMSVRFYTRREF